MATCRGLTTLARTAPSRAPGGDPPVDEAERAGGEGPPESGGGAFVAYEICSGDCGSATTMVAVDEPGSGSAGGIESDAEQVEGGCGGKTSGGNEAAASEGGGTSSGGDRPSLVPGNGGGGDGMLGEPSMVGSMGEAARERRARERPLLPRLPLTSARASRASMLEASVYLPRHGDARTHESGPRFRGGPLGTARTGRSLCAPCVRLRVTGVGCYLCVCGSEVHVSLSLSAYSEGAADPPAEPPAPRTAPRHGAML